MNEKLPDPASAAVRPELVVGAHTVRLEQGAAKTDQRFRPRERLKRSADFRRVYERRCSAGDSALVLYGCENGLAFSRLGVSVSRKLGGAVERNRRKRLFREAFRLCKPKLPVGIDWVIVPRGPEPSLDRLQRSLALLADQVQRKLKRKPSS